jgi:hypothetical protein
MNDDGDDGVSNDAISRGRKSAIATSDADRHAGGMMPPPPRPEEDLERPREVEALTPIMEN